MTSAVSKPALVFVCPEPHPDLDAGRSVHDMLRALPLSDLARSILCLIDWGPSHTSELAAAFPELRLVSIDSVVERDLFADRSHPPATAYSTSPEHWRSAVIFRALAALAKGSSIDYVEFPDRGGLAFCTLQERNLRNFLPGAVIAVRLCTSWTQLMDAEAQVVDVARLHLSDLERKCLRDCDLVVASLLTVAEATRCTFGFSVEEWSPRVVEHALSPSLDAVEGSTSLPFGEEMLVFPSTLQRSQRPDLFVRAVAAFLTATPGFTGSVVLGPPGLDEDYAVDIERLIPAAHASRFKRWQDVRDAMHNATMQGAVVVLTSTWDDHCLTAYNASLRGARLILNQSNPAYGEGTPWQDGVNCLKFDGSLGGLVDTLSRNFERNERLCPIKVPVRSWPWTLPRNPPVAWRPPTGFPLVSVVVAHFNLGAYLAETLDSVRAVNYGAVEIVLVDDASTDLQSVAVIETLEREGRADMTVVRLEGNVGLAAARNIGVRHARGRYVLTLDADDLIHPDFIAVGVEALENNAQFDVVVTPAGYFLDGDEIPQPDRQSAFVDYAMFTGEAVLGGMVENRYSTATALFRKSALDRFPYIESLSCYEDWSLYMRMCEAGIRFIVSNDVFFFYRRRRDSMVHTPRHPERKRIEYSDLMRTSAPLALRRQSRHLTVGIESPVATIRKVEPVPPPPEPRDVIKGAFGSEGEYDVEIAFAALKLSRWAERRTPWLVHGAMWITSRIWRAYRAMRR